MRFTKYHGAGNDFIVIDAQTLDRPWPEVARIMCDRHFGVGSDGIILVLGESRHLRMRMFNPDGSEAEACGNGLRCFVKHVVDSGLAGNDEFTVETLGGLRRVVAYRSPDGVVDEVELSMGAPRFSADEIPVVVQGRGEPLLDVPVKVGDRTLLMDMVSMGNPHAVMFLDEDPGEYPLGIFGPAVERHEMFPSRVNFEIARVRGAGDVDARVWERGAGETLACGTGACAIAVAARMHGLCSEVVCVHLPGGELTILWPGGEEEVRLRGPVQRVFVGDWPD